MLGKNLITAAAGAAGGEVLGVEDVFSTWLYTGNGSTQTITNGIDLAGEGGLVWIKQRSLANTHRLFDTLRGTEIALSSALTSGNTTRTGSLTAFNSDGFDLGNDSTTNGNGATHASWTFRKADKFFDVVTYTGTGANRTVSHSLGSVPGTIIVKRTDTTSDWQVYHRSLANTEYLVLNSSAAKATGTTRWNSTTPTSTEFSLGTDATVNASGGTYVAYLFAHDAGGFGDDGNQSVIKCDTFTINGSGFVPTINLGWEPQWLLVKRTDSTGQWFIYDNMRGLVTGGKDAILYPNLSNAEDATANTIDLTSTGFTGGADGFYSGGGTTYIYIAIRRGPMKTPTDATAVFGLSARSGTGANATVTGGQLADSVLIKNRGSAVGDLFAARLTGTGYLETSSTAAEVAAGATILQANPWDVMAGVKVGTTSTITNASSNTFINYLFRRAPGFFDVVAYTGTGVARTVSHNLGVAPELMIIKSRSNGTLWMVYASALGNGSAVRLDTDGALFSFTNIWNSTSPTSTEFTIGTNTNINTSAATYIAYLFASCPGVSKCFSFTGNGTSQTINCGFAAGAKFVLIKRTDSTGNWLVADTARGIVSGNDPLLYLNSTAAEITTLDWIDPDNSGFIVNQEATANANVNGATYIGLAIA